MKFRFREEPRTGAKAWEAAGLAAQSRGTGLIGLRPAVLLA
jgi:hypothetical protein